LEAKAFAEKFVRTWLHPPSLCGLARASPSTAAVYPCCIPVDDVDEDKVSASFKNSVLTVTLPKAPQAQRKVKRIAVNGK
jgi:hypothetical protein